MIRLVNLYSKRGGVENFLMRSLHVPSAQMVILVNAWLGQEIVFVGQELP